MKGRKKNKEIRKENNCFGIGMRMKQWYSDLPLEKKIFYLSALTVFIPLVSSLLISSREFSVNFYDGQKKIIELNYNQTMSSLKSKVNHINTLSNMINSNEKINGTMGEICRESDFTKQYVKTKKIQEYLDVFGYSEEYSDILFFLKDYHVTVQGLPNFKSIEGEEGQHVLNKSKRTGSKPVWFYYTCGEVEEQQEYMTLSRKIIDMQDYSKILGVCLINIDCKDIQELFLTSIPNQIMYLADKEGNLIAANDYAGYNELQMTQEIEKSITKNLISQKVQGEIYFTKREEVNDTGMELVTLVPLTRVRSMMWGNLLPIVLFYIIFFVLSFLAVMLIAKSLSRRILLLTEKISGVQDGALEPLEVEQSKDEVGRLITSYNYMIHKIQELMQEQFQLGEEKKAAELKTLQSQVNPHFLYNTLNMINWMSQRGDKENVERMICALSRYYKLALSRGQDIITIGEEIELSKAYVEIQQNRFQGAIQFFVDVEDEILQYKIPKLTLQPLIENAIIHGIVESESGRGKITVSGCQEKDEIILSVVDNGVGMDVNHLEQKDLKGSGYGVYNIEQRLTLFFGLEQCLEIESVLGMGTCVSMTIKKKK